MTRPGRSTELTPRIAPDATLGGFWALPARARGPPDGAGWLISSRKKPRRRPRGGCAPIASKRAKKNERRRLELEPSLSLLFLAADRRRRLTRVEKLEDQSSDKRGHRLIVLGGFNPQMIMPVGLELDANRFELHARGRSRLAFW
jgi:hypothetical protein